MGPSETVADCERARGADGGRAEGHRRLPLCKRASALLKCGCPVGAAEGTASAGSPPIAQLRAAGNRMTDPMSVETGVLVAVSPREEILRTCRLLMAPSEIGR